MRIGIPVKPFGVAKARLAPLLDATGRARLGMAIAARTIRVAARVGSPAVVTGDDAVAEWAAAHGADVIREQPGGLDGAASAIVADADGGPWMVLHADLPRVRPDDLRHVAHALDTVPAVLAPSWDGGTSLYASTGPARFSYGPGSFHRHLRRSPGALVLVRPGLALDLDTPSDYRAWRRWSATTDGGV